MINKNSNNIINSYNRLYENNNNKNRNNAVKKEKKGDESTMSLTSSNEIKNNNKNSFLSGEASTNNDNSNSSNIFQKEMSRIIKYNQKLIKNERNNGIIIKHNATIFNNLKSNLNYLKKNYNNKRMKKSFSQINIKDKKIEKTENEKTAYSKNRTKSNKYFSPIDNQKSIYYLNNKSNNNNSKNSSNYMKFNNKNNINNNKFRFVLDKYVINKKKKKEEEKSRNNIEIEKQKYKMQKSIGLNKYDYDKKENSKIITTKKNEENILSNIDNNNKKKEQTQDSFFSDGVILKIPKESENKLKNSRELNDIEENNDRVNTLCNDLGNDTNIKELINLPYYITPKYSNNISNNDSFNRIKSSHNSENNSSLLKEKNKILNNKV